MVLLALAACAGPATDAATGRAIWVVDGDTINLQKPDKTWQVVRLYGIDAPEKDQAYGPEATRELIALTGRKRVRVEPVETDRYGRTVARVYCGDIYVNAEMARRGAAWWYKKYAPGDRTIADAEAEAQNALAGLWAADNPAPPWEWRRGH